MPDCFFIVSKINRCIVLQVSSLYCIIRESEETSVGKTNDSRVNLHPVACTYVSIYLYVYRCICQKRVLSSTDACGNFYLPQGIAECHYPALRGISVVMQCRKVVGGWRWTSVTIVWRRRESISIAFL